MSASILVGYATRYGTTRESAEAVASVLREQGFAVDVNLAREVRSLNGYSAVVLGAPLFMFHWHKDALQFLSRHQKALKERPVAVFALGPTHDPYDEQEWKDSRDQLDKELAKVPWFTPVVIEIFGGKYDPAMLRFPLNLFAGKTPASDIRDLSAVRAWASSLVAMLVPALT
jgi:menaquinone-dependent protoporphyrinogen oxidase